MERFPYEAINNPALDSPVLTWKTMCCYAQEIPEFESESHLFLSSPIPNRGNSRAFCGPEFFIAKNPPSVAVFGRLSSFSFAVVGSASLGSELEKNVYH